MQEHEENCLKINVKHNLKLKDWSVKFKSHFKQLAVPFKIYADFESLLKVIQSNDINNKTSYNEKYEKHIPCNFA